MSELEWSTNSLSTYKKDDWKVQGQGVIEIPESGFYSFAHDVSNGSLKLRINEQLIVNSNHNTTGHFKSDPYYFEAGKLIPVQSVLKQQSDLKDQVPDLKFIGVMTRFSGKHRFLRTN